MSFCGNCGHRLSSGDAYCPNCGASSSSTQGFGSSSNQLGSAKKNRSSEDIYNCPACGEALDAFALTCPACGFELRDKQAATSMADFSRRLNDIEATRPAKKKGRFGKGSGHDERTEVSPTDQREVTLIQSFPIPNTKEDLVEFLVLAASNVDPKTFAETQDATASARALSSAWYSKLCQAYEKAQLVLRGDDILPSLSKRYESVEKAVEKNRKKTTWKQLAVTLAVFVLIFAALFGLAHYYSSQNAEYRASLSAEERLQYDIDKEEKNCKSEESSIRSDISNGEYSDARNAIYALDFDEELSEERHEYWEERKTELLETVDRAESGTQS